MGKIKNLTGKPFGKLTVLERAPDNIRLSGKKDVMWKCVCSCPQKTICIVRGIHLTSGHTKSCGCLRVEEATKHGKYHTRLYDTWGNIKKRCYNPSSKDYKNYGGRGITICPEWLDKENGFINFYNDVSKLPHFGEKGYTLNRIDNDGNYEPTNVEWSTRTEQANNRRSNRCIPYNSEEYTLAELSNKSGIDRRTLNDRLKRGWPIERALTEKPYKGKNQYSKKTS